MPLKLYKRGGIWHYRGKVAGRRLRRSTGTANKALASEIAANAETKAWQRSAYGVEATITFANAAALYRRAQKVKDTKSGKLVTKVEDYWKDTLLKDIKPGMIQQSAIDLEPTAGPATRNRHVITPTQAIINHAADAGKCPHIRVRKFEVDSKIKTPATVEWVEAFMKEALPHTGTLALFMLATGARVSEALAIRWPDINFETREVKINGRKVGAERMAHLPQKLVIALANLPRNKPPFPYAMPSAVLSAWNSAIERAGIAALSFHCCRHGFATTLLHRGVDVRTIAKLGGWKSPQHVLKTYAHALDDLTITDKIFDTTQPGHTNETTAEKPLIKRAN